MGDELDAMRWRARDGDLLAEQADRVHRPDPDQRGGQEFFGGYAKGDGQEEPTDTTAEDRLTAEIHDDVHLSEEAMHLLQETAAKVSPPAETATDKKSERAKLDTSPVSTPTEAPFRATPDGTV